MPAYSSKRRNQGCTDDQCNEAGCKPRLEEINLTDRYFNLSESDVNCHVCGEIVADNERLVQCSKCANKGHYPCIHACELKCKEKKEKAKAKAKEKKKDGKEDGGGGSKSSAAGGALQVIGVAIAVLVAAAGAYVAVSKYGSK